MSDQNDTQPSISEPSAVASEETDKATLSTLEAELSTDMSPSEQESAAADDTASDPDIEVPPSVEPVPQPELDGKEAEGLTPVMTDGEKPSVIESEQQLKQTEDDDEDGDELPLATSAAETMSLSERFNARAEIEDDLQRAENEMTYLREQIRQDPTVLAAVQDQQSKLEYIASTAFDVSEKVTELSKAVAVLTVQLQKVSEETERTVAWSESTRLVSPLSKTFLILAIVVLVALLGGVGYLGVSQMQLQQRQDKVSHLAIQAVEAQNKRQAEFDKQFATLVGSELKHERETINKESIQSKLNRLRGGAAEQRLLRKSSGDWLLPKGKTEELITDHDLIEQLNQLFEKSGRSLTTHPSLPPHKVISILKPNGKGGTDLVVTKETVP
ncbi:hypothetical protein SAMN02745119_00151 [Trichlorobacter thiogenes]|uniref:Uncharacterized protein n=1 Tax=Trichlorobacter thiogenes TaxID=115783 RepID=A0A1T4JXH6_9BACT|nr:hypothetical protein [Trichlorobacter thiogenes]SJZ34900.1 hypothetical protein SAMN02745119_00151 [Trichlorobacter thiogenes]